MEIVKVIEDKPESKIWHVKLDKPRIARLSTATGSQFFEVDYVLMGVSSIEKEDKSGSFHYEESTIIGTDETGKEFPCVVYLTQRALTFDELLFMIGEVSAPKGE